jgi:acetyl-CoA carboxylase carboxyltransferase component
VRLALATAAPAAAAEGRGDPGSPLTPLGRLESLCDRGTLQAIRTTVASCSARSQPGDGVVAGAGRVAGRPVFCYAQDRAFAGGSLGQAHADTIVRVLRLAGSSGAPVIAFVESGGARMDEGTAALAGYARIFRENVALSGRVPQITVVTGTSAGGAAYSPALTDFVVMTEQASMFLTGPEVVREVMGQRVSQAELGGPRVQARNGVVGLVARDDRAAVAVARDLLSYLPQSAAEPAPIEIPVVPLGVDPAALVPRDPRKVYDVRDVARAVADGGRLLEIASGWARNMVTGFARVEGRPVGIVANQPRYLGGVIDSAGAEKAAGFVQTCSAYGIPMVVLVDTPGFLPGTRQESRGVIRYGAGLLRAFASAAVPKITVVLRKAYGGGYITMNSKDLGADLVFAWRGAEIGVVGARQAAGIVHRRELDAAPDREAELDRLAARYHAEGVDAGVAAAKGHVDELIEPRETRGRLAWGLAALGERTAS